MKKMIALLLALVMAFALIACGGQENNQTLGNKEGSDKILIGGVEEYTTLFNGTDEEVKAQLTDAINQVPDGRLILGPGCCVPLNVPEDRLELAKKILATI